MTYSRRDLSLLLPAVAAAATGRAQSAVLPSKAYPFDDMTVKTSGENRQRNVFKGETHENFPMDVHLSELPPGAAPHPPHHHVHEEMILIKDGTMEVTISGKSTKLGPGSVAYVASGEEHGWRNVGTTRSLYFVVAFGHDK
jgi:quercetin dioxygenase-like cupin family protein